MARLNPQGSDASTSTIHVSDDVRARVLSKGAYGSIPIKFVTTGTDGRWSMLFGSAVAMSTGPDSNGPLDVVVIPKTLTPMDGVTTVEVYEDKLSDLDLSKRDGRNWADIEDELENNIYLEEQIRAEVTYLNLHEDVLDPSAELCVGEIEYDSKFDEILEATIQSRSRPLLYLEDVAEPQLHPTIDGENRQLLGWHYLRWVEDPDLPQRPLCKAPAPSKGVSVQDPETDRQVLDTYQLFAPIPASDNDAMYCATDGLPTLLQKDTAPHNLQIMHPLSYDLPVDMDWFEAIDLRNKVVAFVNSHRKLPPLTTYEQWKRVTRKAVFKKFENEIKRAEHRHDKLTNMLKEKQQVMEELGSGLFVNYTLPSLSTVDEDDGPIYDLSAEECASEEVQSRVMGPKKRESVETWIDNTASSKEDVSALMRHVNQVHIDHAEGQHNSIDYTTKKDNTHFALPVTWEDMCLIDWPDRKEIQIDGLSDISTEYSSGSSISSDEDKDGNVDEEHKWPSLQDLFRRLGWAWVSKSFPSNPAILGRDASYEEKVEALNHCFPKEVPKIDTHVLKSVEHVVDIEDPSGGSKERDAADENWRPTKTGILISFNEEVEPGSSHSGKSSYRTWTSAISSLHDVSITDTSASDDEDSESDGGIVISSNDDNTSIAESFLSDDEDGGVLISMVQEDTEGSSAPKDTWSQYSGVSTIAGLTDISITETSASDDKESKLENKNCNYDHMIEEAPIVEESKDAYSTTTMTNHRKISEWAARVSCETASLIPGFPDSSHYIYPQIRERMGQGFGYVTRLGATLRSAYNVPHRSDRPAGYKLPDAMLRREAIVLGYGTHGQPKARLSGSDSGYSSGSIRGVSSAGQKHSRFFNNGAPTFNVASTKGNTHNARTAHIAPSKKKRPHFYRPGKAAYMDACGQIYLSNCGVHTPLHPGLPVDDDVFVN